ncbi:hypothetical protein T11_967 [Trichinella zimbabwensis]|uniref:Uncharacterized protein n=1 Tax=Trichinella zimbabwensis TaxID=268475 RepID=A0A0V1GC22_9BILA|nr:hypothetical protein T11_967 [Trichinella zimbabwensis]
MQYPKIDGWFKVECENSDIYSYYNSIQYVKSSNSNLPKKKERNKPLRTWFCIASKA